MFYSIINGNERRTAVCAANASNPFLYIRWIDSTWSSSGASPFSEPESPIDTTSPEAEIQINHIRGERKAKINCTHYCRGRDILFHPMLLSSSLNPLYSPDNRQAIDQLRDSIATLVHRLLPQCDAFRFWKWNARIERKRWQHEKGYIVLNLIHMNLQCRLWHRCNIQFNNLPV